MAGLPLVSRWGCQLLVTAQGQGHLCLPVPLFPGPRVLREQPAGALAGASLGQGSESTFPALGGVTRAESTRAPSCKEETGEPRTLAVINHCSRRLSASFLC